jgi:hypothetical protein
LREIVINGALKTQKHFDIDTLMWYKNEKKWEKAIASPTLVYSQLWLNFLWDDHVFDYIKNLKKKNTDHNKGFSLSLKLEPCRGIPWRTSSSNLNFQPCRGMTSKEEKKPCPKPKKVLKKEKGIGRLKFCSQKS